MVARRPRVAGGNVTVPLGLRASFWFLLLAGKLDSDAVFMPVFSLCCGHASAVCADGLRVDVSPGFEDREDLENLRNMGVRRSDNGADGNKAGLNS
jgi:hypothetical protein